MSLPDPTPPPFPPGWSVRAVLAERPGGVRVLRADLAGSEGVLRIEPRSAGAGQARAELDVLASVVHPGLARLVDHGVLSDGSRYLAREWIEGVDLSVWSRNRPPEEIGAIVVQLCAALAHLHASGFVHGDLTPAQVIVGRPSATGGPPAAPAPGERAVLTDFGLARRRGGVGHAGGTLGYAAPEVLRGEAPDARADLFSLGALLHLCLLEVQIDARGFYGRFPAEDFFRATGTRPADLPAWARDVVEALLERDPSRRPADAGEVGRTLAGRLGLAGAFEQRPPRLRWAPLEGREAWAASWLADTREKARERRPLVGVVLPPGEAAEPVLDALAVQSTLAGGHARKLELGREAAGLADAAALDEWATGLAASEADTLLLAVPPPAEDPWGARALHQLVQALLQRAREHPVPVLALVAPHGRMPAGDWRSTALPAVERAGVERFLRRELAPEDSARLEELAGLLHEAGEGHGTGMAAALEACEELWMGGDERPRLRAGPLPARIHPRAVAGDSPAPPPSDPLARKLLAALAVLGGEAPLEEVARLAELEGPRLASALAQVQGEGLTRTCPRGRGLELALRGAGRRALETCAGEEGWRALHGRRARLLEEAGAPLAGVAVHAFLAGGPAAELAGFAASLRERGAAERALALLDQAEHGPPRGTLPAELALERALAWCALGQAGRAADALAALPAGRDGHGASLRERGLGEVARVRQEPARALEHFRRAAALDPRAGGEALVAEALLHHDQRRDTEVCALVERLRGGVTPAQLDGRAWSRLLACEAMARFRMGDVERARAMLDEQVLAARLQDDPVREAAFRINLATVERRTGDLPAAVAHLQAAEALHERAGHLAGLAQARALLGTALRDQGELRRAQPLLASALALRERLGDAMGATAVRGMLGMLYAQQGRAGVARAELEAAAGALRSAGRTSDALLLEARAVEVRARLGHGPGEQKRAGEAARSAEGDPRALLSLGRAAWLAGDLEVSRQRFERARTLGASLGLQALADEAAWLLQRLAGTSLGVEPSAAGPCAEEERVLRALQVVPLEVDPVLALADQLLARGRDDLAARLLTAVAARRPDDPRARDCGLRALQVLGELGRGASPLEQAHLRRTLLALPDPWPEDLTLPAAQEKEEEMDLVTLLEINHRLLAQEDVNTLLGAIVDHALTVSGAQRGFLVLEEHGELVFDTALDSRRGDIQAPEVEVSRSVVGEALARMQPLRVSNAGADPLLSGAPSVLALDLRSILCVPFQVEKGLRGVIYVDHRLREGAFDERAQRKLHLLADQAALAILQVRRLGEIQRLNRELRSRVVSQESDLQAARKALHAAGLPGPVGGLVGTSPAMREVHRWIERAAPTRLPVLVSGPSGSGKELAARALHALSTRAEGPLVVENCAALPATLIEAELFGARRGAFTGADRDREGLFERAHGGTLFLDEIGELPLELQAKLLRVLESGEVRRLGDDAPRRADFRLVAATNRDLEEEVREGRFRADLYYRLAALQVRMPPLSERIEDVPALVEHALRMQAGPGVAPRPVSKAVLARLCRRSWPGNVRELFHEVARLSVVCEGAIEDPSLVRDPGPAAGGAATSQDLARPLADLERDAILAALQRAGGDKREAARILGISRAKIYQRVKEWGL